MLTVNFVFDFLLRFRLFLFLLAPLSAEVFVRGERIEMELKIMMSIVRKDAM